MDISSALVKKITYPLWMIKDGYGGVFKYIDYFRYVDELSSSEIQERQLAGVKKLLNHAYAHSRYYRQIFDEANFDPNNWKDLRELEELPILTKDLVRQEFDALTADNFDSGSRFRASTGGSTGVPMVFYRDRECLYKRKGQELFFDRWMGCEIGNKVGLFVASSHYDKVTDYWKAKFRNMTCERMLRFDPHDITNEYMSEFFNHYKSFKPDFIKCFPNSLTTFTDYILKNGEHLPSVKAVACTGENIYSQQKNNFRNVFGGEVFERYATKESGIIASECRMHNGLHVFTEGAYVEIVNDEGQAAGPGEMGRLLVTDLLNFAFPLIRYEIGDMAVVSASSGCECGSALPKLEKVIGRDRDILTDCNGNPKPGYLFVETINKMNLQAQFQIVQTAEKELVVRVANAKNMNPELESLKQKYKAIMGESMTVRFEFVDAIRRDPSGKYRYVVSELKK